MTPTLLSDVSLGDWGRFDVVIEAGRLVEMRKDRSPSFARAAFHGGGRALVPALCDHHHHILAAVARNWSVDVTSARNQAAALEQIRSAPAYHRRLRVIGYDESRHGAWNASFLATALPDAGALKIQHRSGHMWLLNDKAMARLPQRGLPEDGCFYDEDNRLAHDPRERSDMAAQITAHCRQLHGLGIAQVCDMTAHLGAQDWQMISAAFPAGFHGLAYGEMDKGLSHSKLILADHALPSPEALEALCLKLAAQQAVAVHAVTYEALVLALVGLGGLGQKLRMEHVFLADADMIGLAGDLGVSFGVQPGFIHSQGDRIRASLPPSECRDYQRLRDFLRAGIRLYGGTDAPFAPQNPWVAMQAAVSRRTAMGQVLGSDQSLSPEEAFALFTQNGLCEGAAPPAPQIAQSGGILLLDRDWRAARRDLSQVQIAGCFWENIAA